MPDAYFVSIPFQEKGKPLNSFQKTCLETYLKVGLMHMNNEISAESIHVFYSVSKMFPEPDLMYDILTAYSTRLSYIVEGNTLLLQQYAQKVSLGDYIIAARTYLFNRNNKISQEIYTLLNIVIAAILEAYGFGPIYTVDSSKNTATFLAESVTTVQCLAGLIALTNKEFRGNPKLTTASELRLSKNNCDKILLWFSRNQRSVLTVLQDNISKVSSVFSAVFSSLSALYLESSSSMPIDSYPPFTTIFLDREESVNSDPILGVISTLFDSFESNNDVFKYRDKYIRDAGVIIRFIAHPDNIDYIFVREFHNVDENIHMLLVQYRWGERIRVLPINMCDPKQMIQLLFYQMDGVVILTLLMWLGLEDFLEVIPGDVKKAYKCDSIRETFSHLSKLNSHISKVFDVLRPTVSEDNIFYESPVQWNYEPSPYKPDIKKLDKSDKPRIKIGCYTRKLPEGSKASEQAKLQAAQYFIELREGTTLVKEFERATRGPLKALNLD